MRQRAERERTIRRRRGREKREQNKLVSVFTVKLKLVLVIEGGWKENAYMVHTLSTHTHAHTYRIIGAVEHSMLHATSTHLTNAIPAEPGILIFIFECMQFN